MRTVLLFATLTLAAAAARAQQRPPARPPAVGEQKSPAAGETPPSAEQKVGEAPTIPTGQTAAEAAAAVPETGTIEVKPFQILDQQALRKSARKMQEKYVEKGFFLAEVTPKTVPLPNNEVNVIFQVNEHAKITVKEVRFVGNHALSDSELKDAMLTQEGGPFSFLTGAATYREEAFHRDEVVRQALYFDQG